MALELAERGATVDLLERSHRLLQGASRHCEGKIHLGYVYSADQSLQTAQLMATGAAVFMPSIRRWIGASAESLTMSTPFRYAIHRNSLHSADELEPVYQAISRVVNVAFDEGEVSPGISSGHLRRLEPGDDWPYGADIVRAFETGETALDPAGLADAVERSVLDHPAIDTICDATVTAVDPRHQALTWQVPGDVTERRARYDHVVNCSWDGLPKLDATAGLRPARPWSFRMKYFVRLPSRYAPLPTPSSTFVLGPFGDVVDFGDAGRYLSWYPAGRLGFTTDLEPPDWKVELSRAHSVETAGHIADGLSSVLPAVARMRSLVTNHGVVRGGVIFAHGDTDLSDAETELHQRHSIGLTSIGRYHSVNTGKLTMAPYFARQVAETLCVPT